jgi:cellulose synthase operon protein YhjQ
MDTHLTDQTDEQFAETPEDVAILYSWANLHGAKYRDFSASRREYRAQVRHRAAEELRQSELAAKDQAERAAIEAERIAREAERAVRTSERFDSPFDRERAVREAEDAGRRAAAERVEAARRAEAAAVAEAAARREEREIAEAHASAQRQAARWNDSEVRRSRLAGPQPVRVSALAGDPYEVAQGALVDGHLATPNRQLEFTQPQQYRGDDRISTEERRILRQNELDARRPRGFRPDQPSGMRSAYRAPFPDGSVRSRINPSGSEFPRVTPGFSATAARTSSSSLQQEYFPPMGQTLEELTRRQAPEEVVRDDPSWPPSNDATTPAWLFANASSPTSAQASAVRPVPMPVQSSVADTLQHSRERVASRWFALKGVFDPEMEPVAELPRQREVRTPVLAVFSLAGGVGKTSLVAALGRALSSLGEKVLLADTTSHGLLPYYFGATELKPGVVRTFSPPSGSTDAPIHLVSYDVDQRGGDRAAQDALADEMTDHATGVQRLLVDFNQASGWLMRRLPRMTETVLIPVAADMNSVISLQSLERYFNGAVDADGQPILPYYVLNQFDASQALHLDVREVLKRRLGDRLLPYVIRRSPAVSEALAEGMTVVDYQPEGAASEDYLNIAKWLHGISAPAINGTRTTRWSER